MSSRTEAEAWQGVLQEAVARAEVLTEEAAKGELWAAAVGRQVELEVEWMAEAAPEQTSPHGVRVECLAAQTLSPPLLHLLGLEPLVASEYEDHHSARESPTLVRLLG